MHIVRFMEGFANQLFQLCLYVKLGELYGLEAVFADISFYDTNPVHNGFKLDPLYPLRYIHELPDDLVEINENSFFTTAIDSEHNYYYNGFWQDEDRFFPEDMSFVDGLFRSELLSPENREIFRMIGSAPSVSVHVRRGDYLDHAWLGNVSTPAYFANAIALIRETLENPVFFVFSNDPIWCRENLDFGDSRAIFVTGNDRHVELDILMMSRCRHNIISNSSFSWWAQYLNRDPAKIVISPEYWYSTGLDRGSWATKLNTGPFLHVKNYASVNQAAADPFFSILIPLRDQKNGLIRCLSSVLQQPFGNIEIILVDDASTDGSLEIEAEYAAADARIVLIRNESRESLFVSRIKAAKAARGRYLLFADPDDYLSWDACRTLHARLTAAPTEVLSFGWRTIPDYKLFYIRSENTRDTLKRSLSGKPGGSLWNMCWSRELACRALGAVDPFYCDMPEDGILAPLFIHFASELQHTDRVVYYRVQGWAKPSSGAVRKDTPREIIDSLHNRSRFLTGLFAESAPELLPLVQKQKVKDADTLVQRYQAMYQGRSVFSKIAFLKSIDDCLGTRFLFGAIRKRLRRVIRLNKT